MAIRNWIATFKSLHQACQFNIRSMSTRLPSATLPASGDLANSSQKLGALTHANSPQHLSSSQGALIHANSAKVKFLGVFVGFVDDSKRKRQYDKALEKRRRVIHRLRQLQKQRLESWAKQVERLAFNAFTRAYRKTLNTLRSGSKAKQAIFDKATELGTKSAITLTDEHPLMTSDDLKKLLAQEEDHFGRLGWEYLPISVKTAYENLMLSIDNACEELKVQPSTPNPKLEGMVSTPNPKPCIPDHVILEQPEFNYCYPNVMERVSDPENLSAAYDRIKSKLQLLSGKSDEDWNDLSLRFFHHIAQKLLTGTYHCSPVTLIQVRKPGKENPPRTIVVVNPRDQIVAEAVRSELERIYEPVFTLNPKSCHMVLKLVKRTWKGTKWFLHYKAPIAFGKLQHEHLLRILSMRVKDEQVLCLLREMFTTSMINLGDHGSRLSALLCNIYYHQLDMEVVQMQAELNSGSNKRNVIRSVQLLDEEMETYVRVRYVRYAEEFLFGITGNKAMAMDVSERVQKFLRCELKLH